MKEYIAKLQQYTKNLRVLYVEDDVVIRDQTTDFLNRFFSSVDLAHNGKEGLERYREASYDLVVTDINMPEMNGIEMIGHIKKINEEQVILVTSAYNDSDYFIALIELGADKFVMKPFDNTKFIKTLSSLTKQIYTRRQEEKREREIKQHIAELEQLLNFIDHPIALFKNGEIVRVNQAFLDLLHLENKEEVVGSSFQISGIMTEKAGYFYAKNNKELIVKLKKEQHAKSILMESGRPHIFLLRLKEVVTQEAREEGGEEDFLGDFILSLVDVSELETQLETDALTHLPNRNYVMKVLQEHIEQRYVFKIILFSINNIFQIIKWHGKKATLDIDSQIGEAIAETVKSMPAHLRPVPGYFGRNKYLFITGDSAKNQVIDEIGKLEQLAHTSDNVSTKEHANIHYRFKHIVIAPEGHNYQEIMQNLELGFDHLAMYATR